jgi:hypothetical protein
LAWAPSPSSSREPWTRSDRERTLLSTMFIQGKDSAAWIIWIVVVSSSWLPCKSTTVLRSVRASSHSIEYEGRQMKCWIKYVNVGHSGNKYIKEKIKRVSSRSTHYDAEKLHFFVLDGSITNYQRWAVEIFIKSRHDLCQSRLCLLASAWFRDRPLPVSNLNFAQQIIIFLSRLYF